MATVQVDFSQSVGKIKPVHGVGQPPQYYADFSAFRYLKEAGIPFSRLHDVDGWYGGNLYVDIPNLFRDFDKDETDPANYDFIFTDKLLEALVENGVEPWFRLGVTIENNHFWNSYRIFPPKDFHKWARICEMVIRHYTEGWANGYHFPIRYWEIWNEPDNHFRAEENPMWKGTKEEFFELYGIASKHLKACFPHLKIGGCGSCGFYAVHNNEHTDPAWVTLSEYFRTFCKEFLAYVKENDCPLDFFSWHSYSLVEKTMEEARYCRTLLDEYGFTDTESSCNEWNPESTLRGSAVHAGMVCSMLLGFQNNPVDTAMFYDARIGVSQYSGMFNPETRKPYPAYYAFMAFNELYKRGTQVRCSADTDGVYAVAAKSDKDGCVVIANNTGREIPLTLEGIGEPTVCLISDADRQMTLTPLPAVLPAGSFICVIC